MNERVLDIDRKKLARVLKALGSVQRLKVLETLRGKKLSIKGLSQELKMPQSSASTIIRILHEAGLVKIDIEDGKRVYTAPYEEVFLHLYDERSLEDNVFRIEMPLGLYAGFEVHKTCGLCSKEKVIGVVDIPDSFLYPERIHAAALWFGAGYVEYKFPKRTLIGSAMKAVSISLELCSEAPGYAADWPSDITLWVNEVDIGTWTSPADFGGRRGRYTPLWRGLDHSQFGLLKEWKVTSERTYLDGNELSNVKVSDLRLDAFDCISVRIGNKKDAKHTGGVNIFGKGFGNYDQDIVMELQYERHIP